MCHIRARIPEMGTTCTKCKAEIADVAVLEEAAAKYPCCAKCWAEWKEYRVMLMNEMRLDMSMPDHRKLVRKNEKVFVGVLAPEGGMVNLTDEENRNPDA